MDILWYIFASHIEDNFSQVYTDFYILRWSGINLPRKDKKNKEEKLSFVSCIQLMFIMNAVGMIVSFTVTFCIGEFYDSICFILVNPEILLLLFATAILQAFGQIFLFFNIIMFGTLTTSIFQTLRKFITILGAIIIFNDSFYLFKVIKFILNHKIQ